MTVLGNPVLAGVLLWLSFCVKTPNWLRVLAAIGEEDSDPPSEPKLVAEESSARESHRRLLRAHEALCELSEENRARFSGVVQALRQELEGAGGDE